MTGTYIKYSSLVGQAHQVIRGLIRSFHLLESGHGRAQQPIGLGLESDRQVLVTLDGHLALSHLTRGSVTGGANSQEIAITGGQEI